MVRKIVISLWLLASLSAGTILAKATGGHARWRRASTSAKRLGQAPTTI